MKTLSIIMIALLTFNASAFAKESRSKKVSQTTIKTQHLKEFFKGQKVKASVSSYFGSGRVLKQNFNVMAIKPAIQTTIQKDWQASLALPLYWVDDFNSTTNASTRNVGRPEITAFKQVRKYNATDIQLGAIIKLPLYSSSTSGQGLYRRWMVQPTIKTRTFKAKGNR